MEDNGTSLNTHSTRTEPTSSVLLFGFVLIKVLSYNFTVPLALLSPPQNTTTTASDTVLTEDEERKSDSSAMTSQQARDHRLVNYSENLPLWLCGIVHFAVARYTVRTAGELMFYPTLANYGCGPHVAHCLLSSVKFSWHAAGSLVYKLSKAASGHNHKC